MRAVLYYVQSLVRLAMFHSLDYFTLFHYFLTSLLLFSKLTLINVTAVPCYMGCIANITYFPSKALPIEVLEKLQHCFG